MFNRYMNVIKKLNFIVIILVLFSLTGCYKAASTQNGVVIVNSLTGDSFFPETGEFVPYQNKGDFKNSKVKNFDYDVTTGSGFQISTKVRIDHDVVFYKVSIKPTEAHIQEEITKQKTSYYTPKKDVVTEDLINDLISERGSITIVIEDYFGYELANYRVLIKDATRILDNNVVSSIEMSGSFEINPRFVNNAASISTPWSI